jgi:hypothetical protein
MSQVGFKPTIPVFEQAKTVHALDPLDKTATEIGVKNCMYHEEYMCHMYVT